MDFWREFQGPNAGYVAQLYERYQCDPLSVDPDARQLFEKWGPPDASPPNGAAPAAIAPDLAKIVGAVNLAQSIRGFGHLAARLDPLGSPPPGDPALLPETYGLSAEDLRRLPPSLVGGPLTGQTLTAWDALEALRGIYSGTIGYDVDHVRAPEQRRWLREAAETGRFRPPQAPVDELSLLRLLTRVEAFERFLHRTFPGKTRFSIEGLDLLVPMLDEVLRAASQDGLPSVLIGMAHRGRLNVLAHILNKPYAQILAEFKDPVKGARQAVREDDLGWTGDVKYHLGALREDAPGAPGHMLVALAPNPSHLEFVNPVVVGMARAAGTRVDQRGPARFDARLTLPILIHGDIAFSGQGVVAETLNLSRLPGWRTGGTLHLISNNQLGFTTPAEQGRSTLYASDLAKGFEIPIVHVNADDALACLEVARLAYAYRAAFHEDFLIDLIGYRRYGHNEGDEPAFTQPVMYAAIARQPHCAPAMGGAAGRAWRPGRRTGRGAGAGADGPTASRAGQSEAGRSHRRTGAGSAAARRRPPGGNGRAGRAAARAAPQPVGLAGGFAPHPKLQRALERRRAALDDPNQPAIEWAHAEQLALASILADGTPIRLTGEDTERGTFSQRHAVFHDANTGRVFIPLQSLPQSRAAFEVRNSPLSESAAVGFEYGYNVQAPERLVLWEAQYGDFIDGAQVIIDEFIASARNKWGQTPSLALLLPHGYEGQGPDHSSGRPERFLNLAAEINLRIANCTTAAQYFHLLRRQAQLLTLDPLPLIVMTPQKPAAPSGGGLQPERAGHRLLAAADRRPRRPCAPTTGAPADLVQRQGVLRFDRQPAARPAPRGGRGPRGAALPIPARRLPGRVCWLSEPGRGGLGAGRTGEHGRLGVFAAKPGSRAGRTLAAALCRPAAQRQPGRGLLRQARPTPGGAGGASVSARAAGPRHAPPE